MKGVGGSRCKCKGKKPANRAETKITLSNQSSACGLSEDNSREPSRFSHVYVRVFISNKEKEKKGHRRVLILF